MHYKFSKVTMRLTLEMRTFFFLERNSCYPMNARTMQIPHRLSHDAACRIGR